MFHNIGGKIKTITLTAFRLEAVIAVLVGVALLLLLFPLGLLLGPLVTAVLITLAYLGSLKLYALGQLVENSDVLAGRLQLDQPQGTSEPQSKQVKIVCGSCHCEYYAETTDQTPCPDCGSTFRIYPRDDT